MASIFYRIAAIFEGENFHELALSNIFEGNFSRILKSTKHLLILSILPV